MMWQEESVEKQVLLSVHETLPPSKSSEMLKIQLDVNVESELTL
jgi:hypothetical protein